MAVANPRVSASPARKSRPRMFLLHGFVKKTQKIPAQEMELALARKKKLET